MDGFFLHPLGNQMNHQMVNMENINSVSNLNISDSLSEGYLSPASAVAQGWTPQVIYVPSPMIQMIPSPMTSSMIPSPLLPSMGQISQEAMARFTQANSGLGLVSPNESSQQPNEPTFEEMLSLLGVLPGRNNMESCENIDYNLQKCISKKDQDRILYKCPWADCEKTFTRPYNLKSHYRGHTGEKPFICNLCFTGFARKHDLKRHVKIHDGAKSFSCPFCAKCFTRSDALRRHLKNDRSGKETSCGFKQAQITKEEDAKE